MANLTQEVLETVSSIEQASPSNPLTRDQALQIAQIKALIAIARAINQPRARRT